jgi:hypothetical protein
MKSFASFILLLTVIVVLVIGLFGCGCKNSFSAVKCHDGVYANGGTILVIKEAMVCDGGYAYVVGDASKLDDGFDLYTDDKFNIGDTIKFVKISNENYIGISIIGYDSMYIKDTYYNP